MLKDLRKQANLTQIQASKLLGVSLRTYKSYEKENNFNNLKYLKMLDILKENIKIDECHGILTINQIKYISKDVFKKYDITFVYMFGSYAKGTQKITSDIDLLVDANITGMTVYELIEELREKLLKKIDYIKIDDVLDNKELLTNILKEGIKIYG